MAKALNGESRPQMRKAFMFKHLIDNVIGMVEGLGAIEKRCDSVGRGGFRELICRIPNCDWEENRSAAPYERCRGRRNKIQGNNLLVIFEFNCECLSDKVRPPCVFIDDTLATLGKTNLIQAFHPNSEPRILDFCCDPNHKVNKPRSWPAPKCALCNGSGVGLGKEETKVVSDGEAKLAPVLCGFLNKRPF